MQDVKRRKKLNKRKILRRTGNQVCLGRFSVLLGLTDGGVIVKEA
jgi:hypothetical protein